MGNKASTLETQHPESETNLSKTAKVSGKPCKKEKKEKKQTKNEKLIEVNFCIDNNNRSTKGLRKIAAKDCLCQYKGAPDALPLDTMLDAVDQFYESFPDHRFGWDSVTEVKPGTVVIKNYYGYGTHTGKPFAFANFPPIPPAGKKVKEDPCDMICTISRGRLTKLTIDMDNVETSITGPPGYYMSLGGKMR